VCSGDGSLRTEHKRSVQPLHSESTTRQGSTFSSSLLVQKDRLNGHMEISEFDRGKGMVILEKAVSMRILHRR
jgi:hypothetical protein